MVGTGSWKTVALDACGNGMGQAKWVAETPRALLLRITFQSVFHIEQGPHMGRRIMAIDLDGIESIKAQMPQDRKSTRLNSSHVIFSYVVLCLQNTINLE